MTITLRSRTPLLELCCIIPVYYLRSNKIADLMLMLGYAGTGF